MLLEGKEQISIISAIVYFKRDGSFGAKSWFLIEVDDVISLA